MTSTAEELAASAVAVARRMVLPEPPPSSWPRLDRAALYGLAGEFVQALAPYSEADPVALLASLLGAFGSSVGPGPHAVADGSRHPARLNVVLVGKTSRSRKGTSWAITRELMSRADPEWAAERVVSGLASGEGLIAAVRDGAGEDEPRGCSWSSPSSPGCSLSPREREARCPQ